jgi:hypothetical protein
MNELNNINDFLDNSMKSSMLDKPGDDFTAKLMLEIELAKEFQKEDKTTFRYLNLFIIGIIGSIVSSVFILVALLGNRVNENDTATEGILSGMYNFIEGVSQKIFGLLGFRMSGDTVLYVMAIGFVIVIYSLVDKLVFKRNTIN